MSNYKDSKIYMIYCLQNKSQFYVGSTVKYYLCYRRQDHIQKSKHRATKLYEYIKEHGGWKNFPIELIEAYPCKNNIELLKREAHWIKILKPTLNTNEVAKK